MYNFPKEFDFETFKSLTSFKKRISYCNQKLYKIGCGSSRCVYMIDPSTAIKVAKNERGVSQNDVEYDGELQKLGLFPEIYEADPDGNWLIVEMADRVKKSDFKSILGVSFDFICDYVDYCNSLYTEYKGWDQWRGWKTPEYKKIFDKIVNDSNFYDSIFYKIELYLSNYTLESTGDLKRLSSWGVVNDNGDRRLVIVDSGFNDDVAKNYYSFSIIESLNESYDSNDHSNDHIIIAMEEYPMYELFNEFENGNASKNWTLIPRYQYLNLLNRFMDVPTPDMARIPKSVVENWFREIIMKNTLAIDYITQLAGHSQWFPFDEINDYFETDFSDYGRASEFLERKGFYDWCKLPDGSDAWSDYGIEPIYRIISEYDPNMEGWEILLLINKVLDVWHHRGDLASAFIEGGSKTCSEISG